MIFNQGNTTAPDRNGIPAVTLTANNTSGIPVLGTTYALGVDAGRHAGPADARLRQHAARGSRAPPTYSPSYRASTRQRGHGGGTSRLGARGARHQRQRLRLGRDPRGRGADGEGGAVEHGALRLVGRGGVGPGRLDQLRQQLSAGGAGSDRAVPQLRHGRLAELRPLRLRRRAATIGPPGRAGSAEIEDVFNGYFAAQGSPPSRRRSTAGRTTGLHQQRRSPPAACSPAPRASRRRRRRRSTAAPPVLPYDPCYHQACDTFDNNNNVVLDQMSDAIAHATITFAQNTSLVNGVPGKGNFNTPTRSTGRRSGRHAKYERAGLDAPPADRITSDGPLSPPSGQATCLKRGRKVRKRTHRDGRSQCPFGRLGCRAARGILARGRPG